MIHFFFKVTGHLAKLLSRYASILASQGHLQTALNYLENSNDHDVTELRNRLCVSIGVKPQNVQRLQERRISGRKSFSNQVPTTPQNMTTFNNFNTNAINPISNQPWQPNVNIVNQPQPPQLFNQMQMPTTFSPAPATATAAPPMTLNPQRPPSVGSNHGETDFIFFTYVII